MERLPRLFYGLAALVGLAGLAAIYLFYSPDLPWGYWSLLRREVAAAWANPLFLAAGALALGSMTLAWLLERWPGFAGRSRKSSDSVRVQQARARRASGERSPLGGSELGKLGERLRRRLGSGRRMVRFVDELLAGAIQHGASDIHIQPGEAESAVALRLGGRLMEILTVPPGLHPELIRRLKVMGDLVAYQSEKPQDGRFTFASKAGEVDVRLSLVPSHHGERAALRLSLQGAGLGRDLASLGMPGGLLASYVELLARPQGLIVLSGPTGCGKTTTIYASLEHIHRDRGDRTHIATLEDPVEVDLPFLQQTEVNHAAGLGFGEGLRSLLRQDPNVLMVGEIRDRETAGAAIQAGLSGHLILTTLHADSAAGVFHRLMDMGLEPYRVASSVQACLSQRLVRGLCGSCRQPVSPGPRDASALARFGVIDPGQGFFAPRGCKACDGSGFEGRVPLFELLTVNPRLREAIAEQRPTPALEEVGREEGMSTLRANALVAARAGRISLRDMLEAV